MSIQMVAWVLENSEAKLGDRLVLLSIANHANKDGLNSFPSFDTIAIESRLSRRQVITCIQNLERDGHIRVSRLLSGKPNHYEVVLGGEKSAPSGSADTAPSGVQSTTLAGEVSSPQVVQSTTLAGEATSPEPRNNRPLQPVQQPTTPGRPAAPAPVVAAPGTQELLREYERQFTERFHAKPEMAWARDGATAKRLIASRGLDAVVALLPAFFESTDKFVVESGFTFPVFALRINALITAGQVQQQRRLGASAKTAGNLAAGQAFVKSMESRRQSPVS